MDIKSPNLGILQKLSSVEVCFCVSYGGGWRKTAEVGTKTMLILPTAQSNGISF